MFFVASRHPFPSLRGTAGCGPANKKSLVNVIARVSSVQCAAIRDVRYHRLRIAYKFRKLRNCYKGVMRYTAGESTKLHARRHNFGLPAGLIHSRRSSTGLGQGLLLKYKLRPRRPETIVPGLLYFLKKIKEPIDNYTKIVYICAEIISTH